MSIYIKFFQLSSVSTFLSRPYAENGDHFALELSSYIYLLILYRILNYDLLIFVLLTINATNCFPRIQCKMAQIMWNILCTLLHHFFSVCLSLYKRVVQNKYLLISLTRYLVSHGCFTLSCDHNHSKFYSMFFFLI